MKSCWNATGESLPRQQVDRESVSANAFVPSILVPSHHRLFSACSPYNSSSRSGRDMDGLEYWLQLVDGIGAYWNCNIWGFKYHNGFILKHYERQHDPNQPKCFQLHF
jgi:hypothetical protein